MFSKLSPSRYTHNIDSYTGESSSSNRLPILRVLSRPHQTVMIGLEERADSGEDYDSEEGDDDADRAEDLVFASSCWGA